MTYLEASLGELVQFRPKPKQSTNLIELGCRLHNEAILDRIRGLPAIAATSETNADPRNPNYIAPPDNCA